jgi:membrane-associated phospholipid phosphatase
MSASPRLSLPLGAFAIAATVAAILASAPAGHARTASAAPAAATYESEVARIRIHFDSVLHELRSADVSHLSETQRAARVARIAELDAYRERGIFPHNHDFSESWMPYFVDHRGVLCAVAHLLESSGRRDIVDRVAAADNNVWVAKLAGDREFEQWLDGSGLTLDEAARIQVPYIETPDEPSASRSNGINTGAAIVAGTLGLYSIALNAGDVSRERASLRTMLGFTAGALGLGVAASRMDAEGSALTIGVAAGTIGLGSALMATRTLLFRRQLAREAAVAEQRSFSFAPTVSTSGGEMAPGIAFSLKF